MKIFTPIQNLNRRVKKAQRKGRQLKLSPVEECEEVRCMNCGTEFKGRFCPSCGQTAEVKRIKTRRLLGSVFVVAMGGDNRFFSTCLDLIYRPGHMVRDYLLGIRARYFQPVRMLLCLVAVYALASFLITADYEPFSLTANLTGNEVQSESLRRVLRMLSGILSNDVVNSLLSAFIFVLPFKLMFRRKGVPRPDGVVRTLNVAEHFYALVYVSCQSMMLSLALLPWAGSDGMTSFSLLADMVAMVLLPAWCYRQLYGMGWIGCLIRSSIACLITLVGLVMLILVVFGFFYGIDAVK